MSKSTPKSKATEASVYTAELVPQPAVGLTVEQFVKNRKNPTPGNVGICLCGGGSRALSAGLGQLRALEFLSASNGLNLLEQTKAVSTVSGGSWLGVTFEYLKNVADDAFLNTYVSDPGKLVPTSAGGSSQAETLDELPEGNIGASITKDFSVEAIALQAFWLWRYHGTPAHMLWQTVIANHILKPFDLYRPGDEELPTSYFSSDTEAVNALENLYQQNPGLKDLAAQLLSTGNDNAERPYLICNTAMFVKGAQPVLGDLQYLAPVQCTPSFTGIVGSPGGVDANEKAPGGGGVTSFAFNSNLTQTDVDGDINLVKIPEQRAFSLLDIVGSSSAAFAADLQNLFAKWEVDTDSFIRVVDQHGEEVWVWLQQHYDFDDKHELRAFLDQVKDAKQSIKEPNELLGALQQKGIDLDVLRANLAESSSKDIIPQYQYWPVANPSVNDNVLPTRFADGGSLDNTGVASMLSYTDIDNVISFVNSSTALGPVSDESTLIEDPDQTITTDIVIDGQLPPLFGYQPYKDGVYKLYAGDNDPNKPLHRNNKVFPATEFCKLLQGLWDASGNGETHAVNFKQALDVLPNDWFGVKGGKPVTVVWVYTNKVDDWVNQLTPEVKALLPSDFPHYGTLNTELTATEINLLASLTAWCLGNKANQALFVDLYK